MPDPTGYPIVLTADESLMADYRLLFDGMLVASQTTLTPSWLLHALLLPRGRVSGDRAVTAPLGLRRIEAALLSAGFSTDEVIVTPRTALRRAMGPDTRLVGISVGEPLGLGMNTSTMTGIAFGRIYPEVKFRQLLREVHRCRRQAPRAKILVGGPGAWQLAADPAMREALGIDHVVTGYAEGNIAAVFRQLLAGDALPAVLAGEGVPAPAIPCIRGASTMGVVEISRGCGLGCTFCALNEVPMQHLPIETIVADAKTNVAAGMTSISALSEDCFRYGGQGFRVDPPAVLELLQRLRGIAGMRLIQLDHANIQSISRFSDAELRAVREALVGDQRHDYPWVNVGVETVNGELLQANGGLAKMGGDPEGWGDRCAEQVRRLCRAGFFPMVSLVIGLPGETDEDIRRALAWVDALSDERLSIFPMLYAPLDGTLPVAAGDLSRAHWALIKRCYALNFRWIPRMYWDNQAGAGVPLSRRLLLQTLGHGQAALWRALFAWHARRAPR